MSKEVSRTHTVSSEAREKWTKVLVPDEKPQQENFDKKMLSILEEEYSSILTEN